MIGTLVFSDVDFFLLLKNDECFFAKLGCAGSL
jgi:hypothetical protein